MMEITGAKILFTIPILGGIKVSETIVNTWLVIVFLFVLIHMADRKNTEREASLGRKICTFYRKFSKRKYR